MREKIKLFIAVSGSIEHQDQLQASCEISLPLAVGTVWQGQTFLSLQAVQNITQASVERGCKRQSVRSALRGQSMGGHGEEPLPALPQALLLTKMLQPRHCRADLCLLAEPCWISRSLGATEQRSREYGPKGKAMHWEEAPNT